MNNTAIPTLSLTFQDSSGATCTLITLTKLVLTKQGEDQGAGWGITFLPGIHEVVGAENIHALRHMSDQIQAALHDAGLTKEQLQEYKTRVELVNGINQCMDMARKQFGIV